MGTYRAYDVRPMVIMLTATVRAAKPSFKDSSMYLH